MIKSKFTLYTLKNLKAVKVSQVLTLQVVYVTHPHQTRGSIIIIIGLT